MRSQRLRTALCTITVAAFAAAAPSAASAGGLTVTNAQRIDARLSELTFQTAALNSGANARVLLPANYDPSGHTRYPVLYLLNGAFGNETDWTVQGNAEAITAGLPLIVVMPNGGSVGNYTNWYNDGRFGSPEWETFHIEQLVPWIDAHYPTTGTRAGRAIGGLSMGGGGTMAYAARHPDMFVAAAAFSGAVDLENFFQRPVTEAGGLQDGSQSPGAIYGIHETDDVRWRMHNPVDLAENLQGLSLAMYTGNGLPGGPDGSAGDPIEMTVHQESLHLHWALNQDGITHTFVDYGPGGHNWYYWQRDLHEALPQIMATFANPPAPPSPFSFRAVEPSYRVYGWDVSIDRPALEFSDLHNASATGFDLGGSGTATVTTAPYYPPSAPVTATVATATASTTHTLTADSAGRVHLTIALGPGNAAQEYSPQAQAGDAAFGVQRDMSVYATGSPGTAVYGAHVTLARPGVG